MDNSLLRLRVEQSIPMADMVDVVKEAYPKFDKPLLSKCMNSAAYGVGLVPDAAKAIFQKFDPDGKFKSRSKDRHKQPCSVRCRLDKETYQKLTEKIHRDGTTVQNWLFGQIQAYQGDQPMRDHPVIENCERTGWPDGKEPTYPLCPVCGEECETIYRNRAGEIFGCDGCISTADAWETQECFPGEG